MRDAEANNWGTSVARLWIWWQALIRGKPCSVCLCGVPRCGELYPSVFGSPEVLFFVLFFSFPL